MSHALLRLFDGYPHTRPDLGDEVKTLQRALGKAGLVVAIDGRFGPEVQAAVKRFQDAHGLDSDGIVGPRTWGALLGAKAGDTGPYPTTYARKHPRLSAELVALEAYAAIVEACAKDAGVPRSVVAGIGSRESGWGLDLAPKGAGGTGDGGHGRGLMQIDDRAHSTFTKGDAWKDARKNIAYGCGVLRSSLGVMERNTELDGQARLRAAVAGYNCGPGNVLKALQRGYDIDYFTAGRNYSSDVFNRAGWFGQQKGWTDARMENRSR